MSLSNLPEEVFQIIVTPLDIQDLVSLTLTSKRVLSSSLPLVRARLYRHINLTVSCAYAVGGKTIRGERRVRDLFLRTIKDHPACASYIEELSLVIDSALLTEDITQLVVYLLLSSTRLQHLEIQRSTVNGIEEIPVEIIRAVPRTTTELKFGLNLPSSQQLQMFFDSLPRLQSLDLTDVRKTEFTPTSVPLPHHLSSLEFPLIGSYKFSLLESIILGTRHLRSFDGSFASLQYLSQISLSHLEYLRVDNVLDRPDRFVAPSYWWLRDYEIPSLAGQLIGILSKSTALRYLTIVSEFQGDENNQIHLFEYLPKTLEILFLYGRPFLPADSLVAYLLTESQSPKLEEFGIWEGRYSDPFLPRDLIRSICKERQIKIRGLRPL